MDFQMRDGPEMERARFLRHVKDEFHAEPYQVVRQNEDAEVSNNKHKRRQTFTMGPLDAAEVG